MINPRGSELLLELSRRELSRSGSTPRKGDTMTRELFTHPETPAEDGWCTIKDPELEVELDAATIELEELVADVERELRQTIGSVPSAWFCRRTAA